MPKVALGKGLGALINPRVASPTPAADVGERIDLMIETGARVASFAQAPNPALVTRCKEAGLFVEVSRNYIRRQLLGGSAGF